MLAPSKAPQSLILTGDCRTILKTLPSKSIHCCVTSPPYFGLRDYGVADQLGLEQTPDLYVAELVAVFREVHRVLRDDATCWLNLGDSYAHGGNGSRDPERWPKQSRNDHRVEHRNKVADLAPKNLLGIPWRVAFALQADGWYLRQDIIWHKPNPMPESVTDRCTKAHEYIFLLTKSEKYYFDNDAIRQEPAPKTLTHRGGGRGAGKSGQQDSLGKVASGNFGQWDKPRVVDPRGVNKRSVWTVAPKPFKEAHFATFPPALIEPCVLAGCPFNGIVLDPFGGAGTTALVARQNGRRSILIELNPAYAEMARRRIDNVPQN